jgi:glycosyltransferase involved in cell wall biosynthesis
MHLVWINQHASMVGGAEHYIANTARHLRHRGVRSTLLYDPNLPTSPLMFDAFDHAFPQVDVLDRVSESNADLVFMHQTREPTVAAELERSPVPVVEFLHDHWLFCLRVQKYTTLTRQTCTQTASRLSCYPCLGFVHREKAFPGFRLRTISDLHAEHRVRRRFAGFVTGSHYMAEQAIAHGFDANKVHVTPLYADPPSAEVDILRQTHRLLYVGAILPYKGVDILVKALSHTRTPTHLDIVGEGSFVNELLRLIDQYRLHDRITFYGKLNREQLERHYQRATCLVLPSRTPESFGIVGAEAMSHGLPAIVSNVGGALEWLEDGRTGLTFPINDAEALAKTIDHIMTNPQLAQEMGQAARQRYQARFRPEHHVDRLLTVFSSIVRQGGAS